MTANQQGIYKYQSYINYLVPLCMGVEIQRWLVHKNEDFLCCSLCIRREQNSGKGHRAMSFDPADSCSASSRQIHEHHSAHKAHLKQQSTIQSFSWLRLSSRQAARPIGTALTSAQGSMSLIKSACSNVPTPPADDPETTTCEAL